MKARLPALLSINGRDLDTAGFLALHGPFTAHITGNFVTFAAETMLGTFECCGQTIGAAGLLHGRDPGPASRRRAVSAQSVGAAYDPDTEFPAVGACRRLYLGFDPFVSGDGWQAILTGMTLVSAMAVQNA